MKKQLAAVLAVIGMTVAAVNAWAADHGHLNVGAVGPNEGDPLDFDNGNLFDTSTGYIFTLSYTNGGTYAGYYQGNITFTGLAATEPFSGPVPGAAAVGSWIWAQIVSVEGPAGGAFAFWDAAATAPTISVPCGGMSTNLWRLSESNGAPGSDPYGHIHGRRFTATVPGIYTVGFRACDRSTNSSTGGPIHAPTPVLKIYFQAGVNIASVTQSNGTAAVTFGARLNRTYALQWSTDLNGASWAAGPDLVVGNDALATLLDTNATFGAKFYRIRDTGP